MLCKQDGISDLRADTTAGCIGWRLLPSFRNRGTICFAASSCCYSVPFWRKVVIAVVLIVIDRPLLVRLLRLNLLEFLD